MKYIESYKLRKLKAKHSQNIYQLIVKDQRQTFQQVNQFSKQKNAEKVAFAGTRL